MFISSCWHYCIIYLEIFLYIQEKSNLTKTELNSETKVSENYSEKIKITIQAMILKRLQL